MNYKNSISIDEIKDAAQRIENITYKTPFFFSVSLSKLIEGKVSLKLENEQMTGSFKIRGALNKLLKSDKPGPFYTASTGNHAQGFAFALKHTNKNGKVFMPENASPAKVEAVKDLGAEIFFYGKDCLTTEIFAKEEAERDNAIWVSPYNDLDIISGQGTIALEILDQTNSPLDYLFVCVGGGGLISGISTVMHQLSPNTKIVACLPERSPEMFLSCQKGEVVCLENPLETLSDGSAGGLEPGAITFDICKALVNDFELVSEDEIASAIKWMVDKHHKIVEGAAGVALAAMIKRKTALKGKHVGVVICGGNIGTGNLINILR